MASHLRGRFTRDGLTRATHSRPRALAACLLLALPPLVLCWPSRGHQPQSREIPQPVGTQPEFPFKGAGSCSASACHGGVSRVAGLAVLRNEHTTWISDDPHARAYESLFNGRSVQIVRNLAGPSGAAVAAHKDERCLACHTTPRAPATLRSTAWMNADGVGCEACHGAAGGWLGAHTTGWWQGLDQGIKQSKFGLMNTKELANRALTCAGCHVGAPAAEGLPLRDVNHDLIAAGHPRLNFELAAFHDNLPTHWIEKGENASRDFSARAWLIGQLATAKAALDLLCDRASSDMRPWPEFAEYACFSCHHRLADEPWRRGSSRDENSRTVGNPVWGSWPYALLDEWDQLAAANTRDMQGTKLAALLRTLRTEMNTPIASRDAIPPLARQAANMLEARLRQEPRIPLRSGDVVRMLAQFDQPTAWEKADSWDAATQRYLALVALHRAWRTLDPTVRADQETMERKLETLRQSLEFPRGSDSPGGYQPPQTQVPR